jgi:phytoene dehydrogenase-like protein
VVVIGAGHNGLTAGCYLARAGLDVVVAEASPRIGGMTTTEAIFPQAPNHLLNRCAADMVFIRASPVVSELGLERYGYREVTVDPAQCYLGPDGESLVFWRDMRRTAAEIRQFSRQDAEAFVEFAELIDALMRVAVPLTFTDPTHPELRSILRTVRGLLSSRRQLTALAGLFTASAAELIDAYFTHPMVRNPLAVMCAIGMPIAEKGSGTAMLFWGFTHTTGTGRVVGGTGALPRALRTCLESFGGRVLTSAPVSEIVVTGERVSGVRLADGRHIGAPVVIASCDPKVTIRELVPDGALPERIVRRAAHIPTTLKNATGIKVDLAFSGRLELTAHQAARTDGVDLRKPYVFRGTFDQALMAPAHAAAGELPEFFPIAVYIPTAADPSQAPDGQDTVYVWGSGVPLTPREPWETLAEKAGNLIVADMKTYLDGVEEFEVGRWVEPQPELAKRVNLSEGGSWMTVDMSLFTTGPFRPMHGLGGYRTPLEGLFLSGAGTHPGAGVQGTSGRNAARAVLRTQRARRFRERRAPSWSRQPSPADQRDPIAVSSEMAAERAEAVL